VVVSSNSTGNAQYPYAYPQLTKLDPAGNVVASLANNTTPIRFGSGVAVDGCGNVLWARYVNRPSLNDPHALLDKIAP